ncbi:hypothetical protein [Bordetella genomosp. 9]|uniref:hypothetical protein n=1 Tax=Bordetella genomosp. 9 TaxID=1416803 RepID=UPI0012FCD8C9|nr:hypothetical protein [Bordetella genomosp. 9]
MTAKNSSTDSSRVLKIEQDPRTEVECHIFLEDGAHNELYANGGHQVPLAVWYRLSRDGKVLHNVDPAQVHIQLFDRETGCPLVGEWHWSTEKFCTTFLDRKEGETGSKPDDQVGYVKRMVYVSHEMNLEGEGSVLVDARAFWIDPATPHRAFIGRTESPVRVHWRKGYLLAASDLQFSAPQVVRHPGQLDDDARSSSGPDTRGIDNLWRSANIYVTFKDSSMSILKWDVPSTYSGIYTTRRYGHYETAAYIWPYEGKSGTETQTGTIYLWFPSPDGCQTRTTEFQPGNGLVITLVTYVRLDAEVYNDLPHGDDKITIYDNFGSATTLFLNEIIPNKWTDITKSPNPFSPTAIQDAPNRLTSRSTGYSRLRNYYLGYANNVGYARNAGSDGIPCDGGPGNGAEYAIMLTPYSTTTGLPWSGFYGQIINSAIGWCDWVVYFGDPDPNYPPWIFDFYPAWNADGFCLATNVPGLGYNYLRVDFGELFGAGDPMALASTGTADDFFVWCFEPKW